MSTDAVPDTHTDNDEHDMDHFGTMLELYSTVIEHIEKKPPRDAISSQLFLIYKMAVNMRNSVLNDSESAYELGGFIQQSEEFDLEQYLEDAAAAKKEWGESD